MSRLELLEKARDFLSDPERWTQGCGWRDADGNNLPMVEGSEDQVASACIAGAICLVDENKVPFTSPITGEGYHWKVSLEAEHLMDLMDEHLRLNYGRMDFVTAFNDQSTHDEVMAFLDDMIELEQTFAEGRESELDSDIVLV